MIDPNSIFYFTFCMLVLSSIFGALVILQRKAPTISVRATIIEKVGHAHSGQMLFGTDSGERLIFRLGGDSYQLHTVGDSGILRYKISVFGAQTFVSFTIE